MSLFTIPRKISPMVKPYYDLVRKHGRSHKSMVEFICNLDDYNTRGANYAISFNVKDYQSKTDVDNLWKVATTKTDHAGVYAEMSVQHKAFMEAAFRATYAANADYVHGWGLEEARESWVDSDTPYETWLGERVDWSWTFEGRQGGHLCMTECEGINLKMRADDLREMLMGRDDNAWAIDTAFVRKLFIICVQNTVELKNEKISEEVEYCAAWRIWVMAESDFDATVTYREERDELRESAKLIRSYLAGHLDVEDGGDADAQTAFEKICMLADVQIGGSD